MSQDLEDRVAALEASRDDMRETIEALMTLCVLFFEKQITAGGEKEQILEIIKERPAPDGQNKRFNELVSMLYDRVESRLTNQ